MSFQTIAQPDADSRGRSRLFAPGSLDDHFILKQDPASHLSTDGVSLREREYPQHGVLVCGVVVRAHTSVGGSRVLC